ncbi:unnamed protein product [Haemonchus placei]|uniref:Secreted protein n=1 Tax=Haemonchus placei TaxID=6290 RepID=A0A0N4VV16_HAEPC|nr:unnamed protein product [Haemonchus placei]
MPSNALTRCCHFVSYQTFCLKISSGSDGSVKACRRAAFLSAGISSPDESEQSITSDSSSTSFTCNDVEGAESSCRDDTVV